MKIKLTRTTVDKLPASTRARTDAAGRPVLKNGQPELAPEYYFDTLLTGFAVRVSPIGVKAFVVQGRVHGQVHRKTIGRFPLMSPEDARRKARDVLLELANGQVPAKARRAVTVAEVLDEWLDVHVAGKLKPRTAVDYRSIATKVLVPSFGARSVGEVTRQDLAALHHARRDTPRRANYILAVARSFFSYCEDAGHRAFETNPAKRIKQYPDNRRERFLSDDELVAAFTGISALEDAGVISIFAAAALRMCLFTGARQGEMRILRWAEVDFKRRLLLLADSKTGRKPIFLSEPAVAILAGLPRVVGNPYVFVGEKPGDHYQNLTRAWGKVRRRAGLPDVRLHDLRHTFASVGASDGQSLPIIGTLLGHTVPATTARYAHLAASTIVAANDRIGRKLDALARTLPAAGTDGEVEDG